MKSKRENGTSWLMRFWAKKNAPAVARPMFPHRFGFDINYWRSRPDLVEWAQKLYRTTQFHEFMSVLRQELPLDSNSIEAVKAHARVLRIIELMAIPASTPDDEVPATFGAHKEYPELISEEEPQPQE